MSALIAEGRINHTDDKKFIVAKRVRDEFESLIRAANETEAIVKRDWLAEVDSKYHELAQETAWIALKAYLSRAFRRHGVQTVSLLDPSVDTAPEYYESLSFLLEEVLQEYFPGDEKAIASKAISSFLADAGSNKKRAEYITQLANGSFAFFSLAVSPEVAKSLRDHLKPLKIYLDTNILFSLIDLHSIPFVEVSKDLCKLIQQNSLPFTLTYHERTKREMISTINYYANGLRANVYSMKMSRVGVNSHRLSGIELKYHSLNAERGMDVDVFLKPYEHPDVLLQEKGIVVDKANESRTSKRATLYQDYKKFLTNYYKRKFAKIAAQIKEDKKYETLDHDVTVLDAVRMLRSSAASTLDAGALFLTCDYKIYKYDWETSRKKGLRSCTVLPNMLWQIIRPFVQATEDFDRSFAETFAIPEFRTIGSAVASAASRMLGMLASFKEFSEETAADLLSNDLLLEQLSIVDDEENFKELVESAIADKNVILMEEVAEAQKQLEEERQSRKMAEFQIRLEESKEKRRLESNLAEAEREKAEAIRKSEELKTAQEEFRTNELLKTLAEKKRVLASFQGTKDALDTNANREALMCFIIICFLFSSPILGFPYLLSKLKWDFIEPWASYIGWLFLAIGYIYFAITGKSFNPRAFYLYLKNKRQQAFYTRAKFDLALYKSLQSEIEDIEKQTVNRP